MRHTIYKVFLATQYEQEEYWLNQMSARGLALIYAGFCKYIFEDEEPGKYTYKIELLDSMPGNKKSASYLLFLDEIGVEHVASVLRWVYLRKKTEYGPFSLYSDVGSTIKYLRRLQLFFIALTILEFSVGIMNLLIGMCLGNAINMVNMLMGLFLLLLGVLLAAAAWQHTKKIRLLKIESQIRE